MNPSNQDIGPSDTEPSDNACERCGAHSMSGLCDKCFEATQSPFGSHLGYEIKTLPSYSTPYYYAAGPSPLGSVNHFQTIRRLQNYMNRLVKAGKLAPKT